MVIYHTPGASLLWSRVCLLVLYQLILEAGSERKEDECKKEASTSRVVSNSSDHSQQNHCRLWTYTDDNTVQVRANGTGTIYSRLGLTSDFPTIVRVLGIWNTVVLYSTKVILILYAVHPWGLVIAKTIAFSI